MISKIITGILRAIIEYLTSRKTEVKQPAKQDDVRKAGAKKVKLPPTLPLLSLLCLIFSFGCQSSHRIILVDREGVVRLLEDSKKVKVLIQTDDGWVQGKTVIPAGWYAMSLTDDEISEANDGR